MPKLTRYDLIHATNKQLACIGVERQNNAGWLSAALKTEFTDQNINAFRSADVRTASAHVALDQVAIQKQHSAAFRAELDALAARYMIHLPVAEILATTHRFAARWLSKTKEEL